jgi:DNA-binding MarR family transcriptional regulator
MSNELEPGRIQVASARDEDIASCRNGLQALLGAVHSAAVPAWLALDLTMGQIRALVSLRMHGPCAVGGLAELLAISEPTASQLVDRLVKRGLVERREDAADRRRVLVSLTTQAQGTFDAVEAEKERTMDDWLAQLGQVELSALATGLRALVAVSGALGGCCGLGSVAGSSTDQTVRPETLTRKQPAAQAAKPQRELHE